MENKINEEKMETAENMEQMPPKEDEQLAVVTESEEAEKKNGAFFSNFMNKASDIGKKAADGISKGAKNLSEQTQKAIQENKTKKEKSNQEKKIEKERITRENEIKKYKPLFAKDFKRKDFGLPNVIKIVDDAERRDVEVCKGAVGWTETEKGVEFLYLYDEWVKESKIQFLPFSKCDAVYCVDPFDRNKFVNIDSIFERTTSEKIAELEHVAYCLGAKSCSIEIVETNSKGQTAKLNLGLAVQKNSIKSENAFQTGNSDLQGGKNVTYFEGHSDPRPPKLKWFAFDDNINNLVNMRCSDKNSVKTKILEIKCSSSATMSQKNACAIDTVLKLKATMSLEKKSIKEHSSKLIFEIEF